MKTGVPELGLPPFDPLFIDNISFEFFDAVVEFNNINFSGFEGNIVTSNKVDPNARYLT